MIPYPFVIVINSVEKPIKPLEGTIYDKRTWFSLLCIFSIFPSRFPSASITLPTYSSGTSIWTSSYGSHFTPSISLIITSGLETWSSNPSRRIFSIKIDKCSSPRPDTINDSLSFGATFKDTSRSVSFNNLSSIFLAVTIFPSFPTNGDVFTPKVICKVGSSIRSLGKESSFPTSQTVSPTEISGSPEIAIISPASASLISILLSPI